MQQSDSRKEEPPLAGLVAGDESSESVVEAVRRELASLAERDPDLAVSPLAMTCLALARELDSRNSATSKSMCARALAEVWTRLLALAPHEQSEDTIDELQAKRKARLDRQAGAEDPAPPGRREPGGSGGG